MKDLGLFVPYGGEARVHADRASWSSDLSYALEKGLVEKVRIEKSRSGTISLPAEHAAKKEVDVSPKKKQQPKETKKKIRHPSEDKLLEVREANEKLARRLEQMSKSQEQMAKNQELLLDLLQNQQNQNSSEELLNKVLSALEERPAVAPTSGERTSPEASQGSEEEFVFIPSSFRKKERKGSDSIEVEEETSSSSKTDEAAEALRKMRENS